ncbi:MAG: YncE family protein [Gemmatimonadetes bacterium]|nr:YncE family protein [Gemmatimonadota bacterium]
MVRPFKRAACAVVALALSTTLAAAQDAAGYRLVKKIPVGGDGGWDYANVEGNRLYVSHANKLVVIDLARDTVVGEVPNTPGIHGAAIATDLGRGFTSNGRDTTITIFDLRTLEKVGSVKATGANPDAIHYDAASKRVFTFNGRGLNATAIDAATGAVAGTIPLGAKPEFAQSDGKGQLFVNLETDTGQIVVIDTRTLRETKRYWLAGCEGPSGLAYDRRNNRLFSVCGNKVMAVSDPSTGRVVALVPIGPGVDAAAYDAEARLVFASNGGDGTLTVVRQDAADRYTVLGNVVTQRGSRTMALDPRTHRIFLAGAEFGPPPPPGADGRPARAPMVPGSFAILVLEKK